MTAGKAPSLNGLDYGRYLLWLHFAEGTAMSRLLQTFIVGMVAKDSAMAQNGATRTARMFDYIDGELAARPYFAGDDFTAADIMMEFCFTFVERFAKQNLDSHPHIGDWLRRVRARPAYLRAMAVAAPQTTFP